MIRLFVSCLAIMLCLPFAVLAQDAMVAPAVPTAQVEDAPEPPPIRFESPYDYFDQSLMFSRSEILKIEAALAGIQNEAIDDVSTEDPTETEISVPENRYIRLGGIAYSGDDRWMIWLNGQRVTPRNMLPQIVDISVQKNYIDLKWFDELLRKIIKIRLKPNQAYEIRTGVLIPG